jgi:hypothetical protein
MKVRKMSYLNLDELIISEIDYIQDLYFKLHSELQVSISFIYELESQDSIRSLKQINEIKPLIKEYFYNNSADISAKNFQKFRTLIREKVFIYFYDIIKPIPQEKHEIKKYKKIIITDLYTFIPLILNLINFYSDIAQVLYRVCNEFIKNMNKDNTNQATNEIIINALNSFNFSIKLLKELLNFIKTRRINNDLIKELIIKSENPNKPIDNIIQYSPLSDYPRYLSEFKRIVSSSFNNENGYKITIHIKYYIYYLEKYIDDITKTIIKVDNSEYKLENFIKHIGTSLITYLSYIEDITILQQLFDVISIKNNIAPEKLIELLKKIITSIEIINFKLYNANNFAKLYRYENILYGINIIILLKKFIEYLYTNEYIIIYATIINIKLLKTDAFLAYINYKIYPNYELKNGNISIIDDIKSFLQEIDFKETLPYKQVQLDKLLELNTSVIFTDQGNPETIKIFIADLKLYVLIFFQEILTDTNVNNNELKNIIYQNNTKTKFSEILFIKNITSLFKIILYKISNKLKINDSIKYLLQYIIDLTINFCIILAKIGNVNKYLLKGVVNIILLNKLKDYFESDTTITYSYYDYKNIEINISLDDVMIFILNNNLEYDLDSNIIQFSEYMDKKETYANIDNIITKINYQYDYSKTNVTVSGGSLNNKYKKTENKISVIYNKRKYTRVIYISERKKYIKLNKTYMLLSKLKKV